MKYIFVTCKKSLHLWFLTCRYGISGEGADPDKPVMKKAKQLRKERKLAKLAEKNAKIDTNKHAIHGENSGPKSLEDLLNETVEEPAHRLKVTLLRMSI